MIYEFHAYGHPNIQAAHKTTLEFTKDKELSLKGDCIIGVNADFKLDKLKEFIKKIKGKNITITIKAISNNIKFQEKIYAELNPNFKSNNELVVRKADFISERTFAIKANKAAFDLNRNLIAYLKEKKNKISVVIENKQK